MILRVPERGWNFDGHHGGQNLMTGSAGTAVDVLVTCFSKKGGGSGRRGVKILPQLVTLVSLWVSDWIAGDFQAVGLSYFLQMCLKHSACHTFRASDSLRLATFGDSLLSAF